MIYILKVCLQHVEEKVERTIHIKGEANFEQLHEALQEGFGWTDSHLHEFSIKGEKIGMVFEEEGPFAPMTDETKMTMEDILFKGETFFYTYDLGDCWEHEITVEEEREEELESTYVIKNYVGQAPEEELGIDELFPEILSEEEFLFEEPGEDDIWPDLIETAKTFKKRKPWQTYEEDQIIVLDVPWLGRCLFCSVLGGGDQEFGMAIYIGEDGLNALEDTLEGELDPEEAAFVQESILVSFSDKTELEKEDYFLLKEYGYTFRGKKQWPMFRSFRPGYYPWLIDEEEAEIAAYAMREVLETKRRNAHVPHYGGAGWYMKTEGKDTMMTAGTYTEERQTPSILPEIEAKRFKKEQKTLEMEMAVGSFRFPELVQQEEGGRPFFPEVFIAADETSEIIIHNDTFPPGDADLFSQESFLTAVGHSGGLPSHVKIQASEATYGLIPLLEMLKVPYSIELNVPTLREAEQQISKGKF